MTSYETCKWCKKEVDSFVVKSTEGFCSLRCKNYQTMEVLIIDVIECANICTSEMTIGKEWTKLFNFLFHSNICLYAHRQDDIGFHLGWLYQIHMSSIDNNVFTIESSVVQEHLYDLLFFFANYDKGRNIIT